MWYMHEGMGWWAWFGGMWMIVFWAGLIALIVWAITRLTRRGSSTPKDDALHIARQRYAKGELTKQEYEQIKKDLS